MKFQSKNQGLNFRLVRRNSIHSIPHPVLTGPKFEEVSFPDWHRKNHCKLKKQKVSNYLQFSLFCSLIDNIYFRFKVYFSVNRIQNWGLFEGRGGKEPKNDRIVVGIANWIWLFWLWKRKWNELKLEDGRWTLMKHYKHTTGFVL